MNRDRRDDRGGVRRDDRRGGERREDNNHVGKTTDEAPRRDNRNPKDMEERMPKYKAPDGPVSVN